MKKLDKWLDDHPLVPYLVIVPIGFSIGLFGILAIAM